jgi:hypothetical protein
MSTDLSALVLAPNLDIFAVDVTVDPVRSQPGALPFQARGIFKSEPYEIVLPDGSVIANVKTTLGIRGDDETPDGTPMWPALPQRGDGVRLLDKNSQPQIDGFYWVADRVGDGQGGHTLTLRKEAL